MLLFIKAFMTFKKCLLIATRNSLEMSSNRNLDIFDMKQFSPCLETEAGKQLFPNSNYQKTAPLAASTDLSLHYWATDTTFLITF